VRFCGPLSVPGGRISLVQRKRPEHDSGAPQGMVIFMSDNSIKHTSGKKAREFISPSDLTFSWNDCHRCLWLYYNYGVKNPSFLPLVGDLADMQERYFDGASSHHMDPGIPKGKVLDRGKFVVSKPIEVDGQPSKFAIRGKYDILMEFEDGSFGVIDCKFQARDTDKSDFYAPQLEAYAFALENPAQGEPRRVTSLGLFVWSLVTPRGNADSGFGLQLKSSWRPIERNPEALQSRLTEFITMVSSPVKGAQGCEHCRYISERREILGSE